MLESISTQLHHKPVHGALKADSIKDKYNKAWDSYDKMMLWLREEQEKHVIELQKKDIQINNTRNSMWTEKHYFVCARDGTGGEKKYEKLHPEWGSSYMRLNVTLKKCCTWELPMTKL